MKNSLKKIITFIGVLSLIVVFTFYFTIAPTHALIGVPFGGRDVAMIPCTCTAGAMIWHYFFPLFLGNTTLTIGALAAFSTPLIYPNYYLHPPSWALGFYIPNAGAACYIGVEPYCSPLINFGLVSPQTGTSP